MKNWSEKRRTFRNVCPSLLVLGVSSQVCGQVHHDTIFHLPLGTVASDLQEHHLFHLFRTVGKPGIVSHAHGGSWFLLSCRTVMDRTEQQRWTNWRKASVREESLSKYTWECGQKPKMTGFPKGAFSFFYIPTMLYIVVLIVSVLHCSCCLSPRLP